MGYLIFIVSVAVVFYLLFKVIDDIRQKEKAQEKLNTYKALEQQSQEIARSLVNKIQQTFEVPNCSKCNDIIFSVLRFNSLYTGVEIECNTCNKKSWLKTIDNTSNFELFNDEYNYYQFIVNTFPQEAILKGFSPGGIIIMTNTRAYSNNNGPGRHSIPKAVKQEVWQRDGGKCVECGSKENLEYDHIIPISKGGANTARNIQLLCEKHNRSKSDKIE